MAVSVMKRSVDDSSKRLLIIVLDVAINVFIGLYASSTATTLKQFLLVGFVLILVSRLVFDIFTETNAQQLARILSEQRLARERIRTEQLESVAEKALEAIRRGDLKEFQDYDHLKRSIENGS